MVNFVIFTGYNDRAIIAFLRIAEKYNVTCHLIASSEDDLILESQYKDHVFCIRTDKDFTYDLIVPILRKLKGAKDLKELILLPSSEYLNRVALEERKRFNDEGVVIPLVDKDLYENISNKYSFRDLCEGYGLNVPERYDLYQVEALPLVVKPMSYFSSDGSVQFKPRLIYSNDQWESFVGEGFDESEYYIEEFVEGESYYLLFHISKNRDVVCYSQRNLVQQGQGGSMILSESSDVHESEICVLYQNMLIELGFYGLVMIELREGPHGMVMIEANPRLWGPSQLFVDAGIPIFERFLEDCGVGLNVKAPPKMEGIVRYCWAGGLVNGCSGISSLSYHGVDENELTNLFLEYLSDDVYLRSDTFEVFRGEIKKKII